MEVQVSLVVVGVVIVVVVVVLCCVLFVGVVLPFFLMLFNAPSAFFRPLPSFPRGSALRDEGVRGGGGR